MTTQIPVRTRKVVSRTRAALAREGGARQRYSRKRLRIGIERRMRDGWIPVAPATGARFEQVTLLRPTHPLAAVARAYLRGQRCFERARIEAALGRPLDSQAGAAALAAAGFGLLRQDGASIELRAADPRAARLVNRARLGRQGRGYRVERVLEAFLCLPPAATRRHAVTDERRLEVARLVRDEWQLDGDDLLNCRPVARLASAWTFAGTGPAVPA